MKWLGHFEFGLDHKSWFESKKYFNLESINYWLEQWFHNNILKFGNVENLVFIEHQKLKLKQYSSKIKKF